MIGANQQFVVAPRGVSTTQYSLVGTKFVTEIGKDVSFQKEKEVEYKIVTLAIDDNFACKEYDVYQVAEEYKKMLKFINFPIVKLS